jgi:hypothetical protein
MTWSSTAHVAAETTAYNAGRPWLMATSLGHAIPSSGALPIWTSDTGEATDADESADDGPARYAVDLCGARQTYPSTAAATDWWLVLPEVETEGMDTIALINHNLASLGIFGGVSITLEVADDVDFAGLDTVYSATPTQDRWVDRFDELWSGDGYARLHLSAASAFVPRIGEVWIGRTRQLGGHLLSGRDPLGVATVLDVSGGSTSSPMVRSRALGRGRCDVSIRLREQSALSDDATVRAWWRETNRGARPFIWHAGLSQHDARIVTTGADVLELRRPAGPTSPVVLSQTFTETPPFRLTET